MLGERLKSIDFNDGSWIIGEPQLFPVCRASKYKAVSNVVHGAAAVFTI